MTESEPSSSIPADTTVEKIKIAPFYFCPLCRRKVGVPNYKAFISFGGNLNLNCSWPGCKGVIKIKSDKKNKEEAIINHKS